MRRGVPGCSYRPVSVLLAVIAAAGAVNTGLQLFTPAPWEAVPVGLGWVVALVASVASYRTGWFTGHGANRVAGRWIAYPVDEDGIPAAPPISDRLVVDDH